MHAKLFNCKKKNIYEKTKILYQIQYQKIIFVIIIENYLEYYEPFMKHCINSLFLNKVSEHIIQP